MGVVSKYEIAKPFGIQRMPEKQVEKHEDHFIRCAVIGATNFSPR